MPTSMSSTAPRKRRLGMRLAAAGALAVVPLALFALPATASAATPDSSPVVAQQVDQDWQGHGGDRDHRHDHDHDGNWQGGNPGNWQGGGDQNQPPVWTPPSTGSFG
ncbi:hypothetical protein [Nocardia sp. NBC_01327]|uniref:hypothetical protein n=1 Tax=Nocardia sp. NBC_01327 TaxID=2903593 RepID=UPI002E125074|nr:hypothetical protein OG326_02435 [Nocardia sp. NBC_01327]